MVLVTGAAGHIGNVLVRELLAHEYKVRVLILPGEDISALEELDVEMFYGNVLESATLDTAMHGVEYVFHLAGIISIMPGKGDLMRRVNVEGTKNVLQAARRAGVKRLVYTSSIHALSRNWEGTISEKVPFDADNCAGEYDRTKAQASLAVLHAVEEGLDAVIVCPTGVIGPFDYCGSEMGEMVREWMQRKMHMLIEGAYDFVDVRDVARGHWLACERGRKGNTYILSGHQIQLFQLKEFVQKVIDFNTPTWFVPIWMAKIGASISPLYYRLTRRTPKFTKYMLKTIKSNSVISNAKACRELEYKARPVIKTITDTVKWMQRRQAFKRSND
ncbi:MAG TPA: SDR family oxidoreductase [Anaerolineae bacterium]|nr:SDR family oxidoreductase [Anaerolineae bacterium]